MNSDSAVSWNLENIMATFKIITSATQVKVISPYNTNFVAAAKNAGGKFDRSSNAWVFDIRDEARARALCLKYYGTDGLVADLITLRVEYKEERFAGRDSLTVNGRPIARATGRDSGAVICDGIILLTGGFRSAGSFNNWGTEAKAGTAVLVRDFPRAAVDALIAKLTPESITIYSIEPEIMPVDVAALTAERVKLAARIAEIDAILATTAALLSTIRAQ